MKCEYCGSSLDSEAGECKYCGAPSASKQYLEKHHDCGSGQTEKRSHSDELRPMSAPDISFLKKNQKKKTYYLHSVHGDHIYLGTNY